MHEYLQINADGATLGLFAGILVVGLMFSFILYFIFSYRHKQKDYQLLQSQKEQIDNQNILLEQTLEELKLTQTQLIHREKLASLGELTAGIAHEIQNPLNFINNFSDVNKELVEELKMEKAKAPGERDEQLEDELLNDIKENEEKINHHGKRADAIVKGMLQHSRSGTGEKELTDINDLAGEFLKLSYHGLRAKDKNFNAFMLTDFDNSLPKINIIPQEISRVLLNLYNNAFYAVTQKKNMNIEGYEPTISVATRNTKKAIEIKIKDNGTGIPKEKMSKIFQPFFTTKPTGEGTGLGLSLSYDIIKSHGGKITVQSEEGSFTEFTVSLPA